MQKLDFIIGGNQKCGTSALFAYLSAHPQLSVPVRKELHFFDNERVNWASPDYAPLHGFFPNPGMRFDTTPIYLFWPPALERIRSYRPDIKLIFLFREPAERAFSHWSMSYARGVDTLTFAEAIRGGRARVAKDPRRMSYVERGFYGGMVARLLGMFDRRQLLFLSAHDLAREPQPVLDRIAEFVGIEPMGEVAPIRKHERPAIDYPSRLEPEDVEHLARLYRDDLGGFAEMTGIDISGWLTMRSAG